MSVYRTFGPLVRGSDTTNILVSESEKPPAMAVQPGVCLTWSKNPKIIRI